MDTMQERHMAFQVEIGAVLNRAASLNQTLQSCAEAIVHHLEGAFARIWTLHPEGDMLELQASAGMYTHLDGSHSRIPIGQFKIGLIAAERTPHLTNTVIGDPRVSDQEWAKREGMVAFAGYPLLIEDISLPGQMAASFALLVAEIISNAVKHGAGDIELTLTTEGSIARLAICDNGPGFPPGFDWQKAANTGLGLIESAGRYDLRGTISFENREEGGACVVVVFPLAVLQSD